MGLVDVICVDERHVRDVVARHVFWSLRRHIFPVGQLLDIDLKLADRCKSLFWLEPRHLDIPEILASSARLEHVASDLRRLHLMPTPGEMLEALEKATRVLTESAAVLVEAGLAGSSDGVGADVALPLFVLALLCAKPPALESTLRFLERFTSRSQLLTEAGYALVQARAAASFVEMATSADFVNLQSGEWEQFMGKG